MKDVYFFFLRYFYNDVNDVTGKDPGVFPASVGAFHLERPLKFPFTSLTVHSVGRDSKIRNLVLNHLHANHQISVYFLSSHFLD